MTGIGQPSSLASIALDTIIQVRRASSGVRCPSPLGGRYWALDVVGDLLSRLIEPREFGAPGDPNGGADELDRFVGASAQVERPVEDLAGGAVD